MLGGKGGREREGRKGRVMRDLVRASSRLQLAYSQNQTEAMHQDRGKAKQSMAWALREEGGRQVKVGLAAAAASSPFFLHKRTVSRRFLSPPASKE